MNGSLSIIEDTPIAELVTDLLRWNTNAPMSGGIINAQGQFTSFQKLRSELLHVDTILKPLCKKTGIMTQCTAPRQAAAALKRLRCVKIVPLGLNELLVRYPIESQRAVGHVIRNTPALGPPAYTETMHGPDQLSPGCEADTSSN